MKKNWNNPQLNQLETKFTEEEIGVISFSQDSNGANAEAQKYIQLKINGQNLNQSKR